MCAVWLLTDGKDRFDIGMDVCTAFVFTHFGLVTPYGEKNLGQHWLR